MKKYSFVICLAVLIMVLCASCGRPKKVIAVAESYLTMKYGIQMVHQSSQNIISDNKWYVYFTPKANTDLKFYVTVAVDNSTPDGYRVISDTYLEELYSKSMAYDIQKNVSYTWAFDTQVDVLFHTNALRALPESESEFSDYTQNLSIINGRFDVIITYLSPVNKSDIDAIAGELSILVDYLFEHEISPDRISIYRYSKDSPDVKKGVRLATNAYNLTKDNLIDYLNSEWFD